MASSSSSSHTQKEEFNAFDGIEPPSQRWKASESWRLFDVFINHRGPDVKHTLATHLYNSLQQLRIGAFLDSREKELGNSFPSTIKTAIRSAKVHIAIFSKGYADSPWCLAELVQMLESKAKIIPVFYEVEPWELRHIERGQYAASFIQFKEKGRYLDKLSEWKEALQYISFVAGEEFHHSRDCENVVAAVQKEVFRKRCLYVAKYPVGLNNLVKDFESQCLNELVHDFENQCRLQERKHKPNIVGIFGMGGIGKTTLAKELFNRKKSKYSRSTFLFDVREAAVKSELPSMQSKLHNDLFDGKNLNFTSIEEGASYLKDCAERSRFSNLLIVVDNIDHTEQLDALLIMDILAKSRNSLVIVTTRDVGVVISAGITVGYPLRRMDTNHGRELFCWHAFGQPCAHTGYEALVDEFVDACGGLPLSLQVLGRHVHRRDHSYWELELAKAKTTLPQDVKKRLRISFESLDEEEKQIFMDTACFFVNKDKSIAERVWEASGWNARHALKTLKDKCLLEEFQLGVGLRMHDHLRDLGRELADEFSPPHRLWRPQDLNSLSSMGFKTILTKTNIRCSHSMFDESTGLRVSFFLCHSDGWVETSASLPWLHIMPYSTELPCIPSWIPLQKLRCLIIQGQLKKLWENGMQVPSQLKELQIIETSLKKLPDFSGTSANLQNSLLDAQGSPNTGSPLLEFLNMNFFDYCLRSSALNERQVATKTGEMILCASFVIVSFNFNKVDWNNAGMSSSVRAPVSALEKLEINYEYCVTKIIISGMHYPRLQSIRLHRMEKLKKMDLRMVKTLNCLEIADCKELKRLSGISDLVELVKLKISGCLKLKIESLCLRRMKCLQRISFDENVAVKYFELDGCQNLNTAKFCCEKIVELRIRGCPELKQMPDIIGSNCLERLIIDGCGIRALRLHHCRNLKSVSLANTQFTVVEIYHCPELPSLARLSSSGTAECHRLQWMKLGYCSSTLLQNCIRSLKNVPPEGLDMIGRAVDGAESRLNENLFYEATMGVDGVIEIGPNYPNWSELSAIVVCLLVKFDSLVDYSGLGLCQGEWIITLAICHDGRYSYFLRESIEIFYKWKGVLKKGFRVEVRKGEECKCLDLLSVIVDKLYY